MRISSCILLAAVACSCARAYTLAPQRPSDLRRAATAWRAGSGQFPAPAPPLTSRSKPLGSAAAAGTIDICPARVAAGRADLSMSAQDLDMWRIEAVRLEERHRQELMRRPPRFLPFKEARKWARAMWFTSREDWMGMINRGEKRNPYLPRRPDEYYAGKGWVSWDDFLNEPEPLRKKSSRDEQG